MYASALKNSGDAKVDQDLATRCQQLLILVKELDELRETGEPSAQT